MAYKLNGMYLCYVMLCYVMLCYVMLCYVMSSGVETRGAGGALAPPLFCNAVSNENNMKNIEITNGLIFKKHVAFLTSRLPMILCP